MAGKQPPFPNPSVKTSTVPSQEAKSGLASPHTTMPSASGDGGVRRLDGPKAAVQQSMIVGPELITRRPDFTERQICAPAQVT